MVLDAMQWGDPARLIEPAQLVELLGSINVKRGIAIQPKKFGMLIEELAGAPEKGNGTDVDGAV
jgi:hypothetical protein